MKRVSFIKLFVTVITIIVTSIYLVEFPNDSGMFINNIDGTIYILSLLGWVCLFFCIITWKKLTGCFISMYSIYLLFIVLFTYGQCLMWALGIHLPDEIGKSYLYTFNIPNKISILKTQMLTLASIMAFHCGSVMFFNKGEKRKVSTINVTKRKRLCLYNICILTSIISTPLMFYSIIRNIIISRVYGYGAALYNTDVVAAQNNLILLLRLMYFPSIVGLLIGSKYEKRIMYICYINFFVFTLLGLLAGDRGEWLFPLFILVWMHNKYLKKIDFTRLLKYAFVGLVLVIISVAIRDSRSNGITAKGVIDAIIGETNPIVSAVFELGGSMRPTLIILENGWGQYPFGNSYILALLGMVTERIIMMFIPDYLSLSAWFSHSYLGIRYGAGFSIVAEALMNYGPYVALISIYLLGALCSKLFFSIENIDINHYPIYVFFAIGTAYSLLQIIRNTLLVGLKMWIFSTVIMIVIYHVYYLISNRRKGLQHLVENEK